MEKKSTLKKNKEGYGYKYTELAEINKYCEENKIRYYQEVETNEINQKDYIVTYLIENGETTKHRGCQIVDAILSGIKNPVQEYGSSLTYCRRYSLLMALGLATEDDDGASLTQKEPTKEDAENYVINFGKYKGQKLAEVVKNDWYKNYLLSGNDEYIKKCIELLTGTKALSDDEFEEKMVLISEIQDLERTKNIDHTKALTHYKVESDSDMTLEQLRDYKVRLGEI